MLVLFFTSITYCQKNRTLISGVITQQDTLMYNVHIINKNSNQGSTTNDFGIFEIAVKINDTLEFTHVSSNKKMVIITSEIIEKNKIFIKLNSKTYQLEGFTLERPTGIFYVDKKKIPPPTVNAITLGLPYAKTKANKNDATFSFRSGGILSLDNLINTINGNNRRKKALQKLTYEDRMLKKIRTHYTDDFFIRDLSIEKKEINNFLNYCIKDNIINLFNKKNMIKLLAVLMKESVNFVQIEKTKLNTREKK